jgi:hypothetical protein
MEIIINGDMGIKEKENPPMEPEKFSVREYKPRFARVTAYRLPEDSKIHCCDGTELSGTSGDFYVCLDEVQEFILPEKIFRKMFLLKTDEAPRV